MYTIFIVFDIAAAFLLSCNCFKLLVINNCCRLKKAKAYTVLRYNPYTVYAFFWGDFLQQLSLQSAKK